MLTQLCRAGGIALTILSAVLNDGGEVSSSRIRASLLRGDVVEAAMLLGRPYQMAGKGGVGQRRGKTLGFPTANLEEMQTLVPGNGVYAVRAHVGDTLRMGAANVGPNPTFGED